LACPSGGSCVAVGSTMNGTAPSSATASMANPGSPTPQWSASPTPAVQPSGN
jgi:hypothetical protein